MERRAEAGDCCREPGAGSGLDPIKALFWSAVINGVVAVPLMVIIMFMAVRMT